MCSAEAESRALVHALVPKVLASRDDMSPKQICNAFYGLKNMFSSHEEIRLLLGPLTEKLNMCAEPISLQSLSAAFYSLQVRLLLQASVCITVMHGCAMSRLHQVYVFDSTMPVEDNVTS